jgi:hypothetical protein
MSDQLITGLFCGSIILLLVILGFTAVLRPQWWVRAAGAPMPKRLKRGKK